MTNHMHLVVSVKTGNSLSGFVRDFKKFSSFKIVETIRKNPNESRRRWMNWIFESNGNRNYNNENFQFWQQTNHPIECSNKRILESRIKYVHENPVKAEFVRNEWDYIYSSAIDFYTDEKGLLDLVEI